MMYSAWTMAAMVFPSSQLYGREPVGQLVIYTDPRIGLQE